MKKILHKSPKTVLLDCITINSLANNFGKYFAVKIVKLRSGLESTDVGSLDPGPHKKV